MKKTDVSRIVQTYPSYEAYLKAEFDEKIPEMQRREASLSEGEAMKLKGITGNIAIIRQILNTYTPSERVVAAANRGKGPVEVYIITENWCGSSRANLPYIVKILQSSPAFNIRVALRDSNPGLIEMYLTPTANHPEGARSIPKVIGVDAAGHEVINWGPRTASEQKQQNKVNALNLEFWEGVSRMKEWYANHNGQAIEEDMIALFEALKTAE